MAAPLTIYLALYIVLIILPGYMSLIVAGYPANEKGSFLKIFIRGSLIFSVFTCIVLSNSGLSNEYINLFTGSELINGDYLMMTTAILTGAGMFLGALQLLFDFTLVWYAKTELKLTIKRFFSKGSFEVSPGDSLKKLLTCYRIANKRPFVKIHLDSDLKQFITGQIIKYNWNGHEQLLIMEADTNNIIWLEVDNCKAIQFTNINEIIRPYSEINNACKDIRKERGEILELLHPGLFEVYLDENGNLKNG